MVFKENEWIANEEKIRKIIYFKSKNAQTQAIFQIKDICPNATIDEVELFMKWLKKRKIVSKIELIGHNTFSCIATDELLEEEIQNELFKK